MKTLIAATGLVALSLPAQANAQDTGFSGPRVQLDIAYDQLDASDDYVDLPRHFNTATIGISAGYDHMVTKGLLVGAELGFGKPLGDKQIAHLGSDSLTAKPGRELYAAARIGTPVTRSTLLFASAGYSNAGLNVVYHSGPDRYQINGTKGGFLWGGGVEQKLGGSTYVSLAYRGAHYGDYRYALGARRAQVRLGAGMRF